MSNISLPILSRRIGGWDTVGHATTVAGAKRTIMKLLSSDSLSLIRKHGFKLVVSQRTPLQQELNGGPRGFVWSICK